MKHPDPTEEKWGPRYKKDFMIKVSSDTIKKIFNWFKKRRKKK